MNTFLPHPVPISVKIEGKTMFKRIRSDLGFMAFALAAVLLVLTAGEPGTAEAVPYLIALN